MRGFLFGVVLGAFLTALCMGAMPDPVNSMVHNGICSLADMAGQDLGKCAQDE